jgi:hypothetical protein
MPTRRGDALHEVAVTRSASFRSIFISSSFVLCSLVARPSAAADEKPADDKAEAVKPADKPAEEKPADKTADKPSDAAATTAPTAPGASADASASATVDTSGASAELDASSADAAAGAAPSFEHPVENAPGAARCSENFPAGDHPEYKDHSCYEGRIESANVFFYGGLEVDVGYAKYTYRDDIQTPDESLHDLRGRFVVGPMLHHEFGKSGFFVAATGQLVGWVRDQFRIYQINVDDAYGQVGGPLGGGRWDFQIGRFMTWRVFHKGMGFDLYTLEDRGAASTHNVGTDSATYGTHTYEVNYIYLRNSASPIVDETAGRAALHYFPLRSLGFELAGAYGQTGSGAQNTLGGRLAIDFHAKLGPAKLRLSAAAEERIQRPSVHAMNQVGVDPAGDPIYKDCDDCGVNDHHGVGGGGVLKVSIAEAGGGVAQGWDFAHGIPANTTGAPRVRQDTSIRQSYGGYLQLDPGTLLFKRPLIIGAALFNTHLETRTDYYENHMQGAAYIGLPLGFNDAIVKLVLSRAELDTYKNSQALGAEKIYDHKAYAMTAGRVRFAYYF